MVTTSSDRFIARYRAAIIVFGGVAAVVLAVLAYRSTTPKPAQPAAKSGAPLSENELLRVGALPVT